LPCSALTTWIFNVQLFAGQFEELLEVSISDETDFAASFKVSRTAFVTLSNQLDMA